MSDGTLGTWNTSLVCLELKDGGKLSVFAAFSGTKGELIYVQKGLVILGFLQHFND